MENSKYLNLRIGLIALFSFFLSTHPSHSFIETKRFDAKASPRAKYLANSRPSTLRYADPITIADRRVLLSLAIIPTSATQAPLEENATAPSSIPLIAYESDEMPSLIDPSGTQPPASNNLPEPQPILPVADPFNESTPPLNLNSTDDLLNLFEQSNRNRGMTPGYNSIPFIPPFTSAPDNLRVDSKASYKKVRK